MTTPKHAASATRSLAVLARTVAACAREVVNAVMPPEETAARATATATAAKPILLKQRNNANAKQLTVTFANEVEAFEIPQLTFEGCESRCHSPTGRRSRASMSSLSSTTTTTTGGESETVLYGQIYCPWDFTPMPANDMDGWVACRVPLAPCPCCGVTEEEFRHHEQGWEKSFLFEGHYACVLNGVLYTVREDGKLTYRDRSGSVVVVVKRFHSHARVIRSSGKQLRGREDYRTCSDLPFIHFEQACRMEVDPPVDAPVTRNTWLAAAWSRLGFVRAGPVECRAAWEM